MKWLSTAAAAAALLSSFVTKVNATEASPHLYEEVAPDGELITLGIAGGPEGSIEQTVDGYSVMNCDSGKNKGFKCYANYNPMTGNVEATDVKVSKNAKPEKMGLMKGFHVNKTPFGKAKKDDRARRLHEGKTEEDAQRRRLSITTGTTKNLVIPILFPDHVNRPRPTQADMDILFNSPEPDSTRCPTGSIQKYFKDASFNTLTLESDVLDWVLVPNSEAHYANGNSGLTTMTHQLIKDALDLVDNNVNFVDYDKDNDGTIDVITFLHSGYAAEWGGTDSYGTSYMNRIWSHKWAIYTIAERIFDGIQVYNYHISPAIWGTSGSAIGRIGVICHETGHYFSLPDLYDTDNNGEGIGSYGLMANSWGFDGSQRYPPKLSPWSQIKVGWLLPAKVNEISSSGNYEAFPSYTGGPNGDKDIVYKISSGYQSGEYLLIENRQKIGFELAVPKEGLCIWHIDESVGHLDQGYPGQTGWPANGLHYQNSLLQADGNYEMEKNQNRGNGGDVYQPGMSIGPSTFADPANGPFPNTDSYKGGVLTKTDITIDNIVANGENFLFSVSFGETVPTMSPTKTPTAAPVTSPPTKSPTKTPTAAPVTSPPTKSPTKTPTATPTISQVPTQSPTSSPTKTPTQSPTKAPTQSPTSSPTKAPTPPPTLKPDGASCSSGTECQSGLCRTTGPASERGCYSEGGDGGGGCTLLAKNSACNVNGDCCSGVCKTSNNRCE